MTTNKQTQSIVKVVYNNIETIINPTKIATSEYNGVTDIAITLPPSELNLFKTKLYFKSFELIVYQIEDNILLQYIATCNIMSDLTGGQFYLKSKDFQEVYDIKDEEEIKDLIEVTYLRR